MTKGSSFDERRVKSLIRRFVAHAKTISNVSGELAMSLPTAEEGKFSQLLKELSENKTGLGVDNFGLSVTTMEDVFLAVGNTNSNEDNHPTVSRYRRGYFEAFVVEAISENCAQICWEISREKSSAVLHFVVLQRFKGKYLKTSF